MPLVMRMMMNFGQTAAAHDAADNSLNEKEVATDREVRRLGSYFNIEDEWVKRLEEALEGRQDTKARDLAKLYELLDQARNPTGMLLSKIEQMESGEFGGNFRHDEASSRLVSKFDLDDEVKWKLAELRVRRRSRQEEDLERLEQHLQHCTHKSWTALALIKRLVQGRSEELPDMKGAEALRQEFSLDCNAMVKLREIIDRRCYDIEDALTHIKQILQVSYSPSEQLVNIADTVMAGEMVSEVEIRKFEKESKRLKKANDKKGKKQKKDKTLSLSSGSASGSNPESDSSSDSDSSSTPKKKTKKKDKKKGKQKKKDKHKDKKKVKKQSKKSKTKK